MLEFPPWMGRTAARVNGHIAVMQRRVDPTGTGRERAGFEAELVRRFDRLRGQARAEFVRQARSWSVPELAVNFDFPRNDVRARSYLSWLQTAVGRGIFDDAVGRARDIAMRDHFGAAYVETAYRRGMLNSAAALRSAGASVADDYVDTAIGSAAHQLRLAQAWSRSYDGLQGITAEMSEQIASTIVSGMARGDGVMAIADAIAGRVDKIGITRARLLARTEVISAHANAQIETFLAAGIDEVEVDAEWSTALDADVCPICEALAEGGPYLLSQAANMLPAHPNCRCAWAPKLRDLRGVVLR